MMNRLLAAAGFALALGFSLGLAMPTAQATGDNFMGYTPSEINYVAGGGNAEQNAGSGGTYGSGEAVTGGIINYQFGVGDGTDFALMDAAGGAASSWFAELEQHGPQYLDVFGNQQVGGGFWVETDQNGNAEGGKSVAAVNLNAQGEQGASALGIGNRTKGSAGTFGEVTYNVAIGTATDGTNYESVKVLGSGGAFSNMVASSANDSPGNSVSFTGAHTRQNVRFAAFTEKK